jgi:hypothetical protein
MTPKEKADHLVMIFRSSESEDGYNDVRDIHAAIRCALIAVDEMLGNAAMIWGGRNTETGLTARDEFRKYWYEVKQELEKL